MAVGNNNNVKAPTTYVTWAEANITVAVGEEVTVAYTGTGQPLVQSNVEGFLNGIATANTATANSVTFTGVNAGTATIPYDSLVGQSIYTASVLEITVTAATEDESYLNKRGLTHFWENIDDIKQDKLTAGDNISITSNTISADTGWVYLGEQSLSADSDTLTYTLPAQYDNYKVVFYGAMDSTASDGGWIDFIMYNGSTAISVTHQVQRVEGTTWSSLTNANVTYAINGQSNPYAGVTIKFESYRAGDDDWRSYTGSFASNNGVGGSIRTSIVNGRATSGAQPTAFTVKSYGGNFNTGSRMRVWASNNEH